MTPESAGPLSRPLLIDRLPPEGTEVTVEATEEEREALAADFNLPAIHSLEGRYRVTGSSRGVSVVGRVRARITQECVVTLDLFESTVEEAVAVDFAPAHESSDPAGPEQLDRPDEIVDGRIDVGTITAEFLALGLDPYPKKPGVDFSFDEEAATAPDSPFAALGRLKRQD